MMKAVILAGGKGSRITEESQYRPKPMVGIGERPILWHIMKRYDLYNIRDFIICCGYKGHMIKEYFRKYSCSYSNLTLDMSEKKNGFGASYVEDWHVTLANSGLETLTAGRILKIKDYVNGERFMLTYGDGVADIDLDLLLACHRKSGKILTITLTKPDGRFGAVDLDEASGQVYGFKEKARDDQSYVNAGYMVCEPEIFAYLGDGNMMLEAEPFERLAREGQMNGYIHTGFWSPMDNLKDKEYLENLYYEGSAVWLQGGNDLS